MEDFCRRAGTFTDASKVPPLIGETIWISDENAYKSKFHY